MAPTVPTRQLGKNGPQVTALGWGAMQMGYKFLSACQIPAFLYGDAGSDAERLDFIDQVYDRGNSEMIFKADRKIQVFLATKFGIERTPDGPKVHNDPEYIRLAIDKSLKRLQTDHLDLWYCHRLNGEVPVETVVSTMAEAVNAGKVKYLGLSECSATTLRRAHKTHPISAVQIEYSPFSMEIEDPKIGLLKTCRELGVAVIAYSPLGRGMLTGQYRSNKDFPEGDYRRTAPRFSDENFPKNIHLVDALKVIADRKGITTGQLTLAWLMKQGEDIIPIPGTKKLKNLEENLASLDMRLSEEDDREIRAMVDKAETSGDRYPGIMNKYNFMDTPPLK
ncbi:MAG: hypothetical protein LQ350_004513 [Teloschistes chrysophthalmus]|nr:MAG: hypothetical protein LQ350_004513 [Niorma chrysophthalma]